MKQFLEWYKKQNIIVQVLLFVPVIIVIIMLIPSLFKDKAIYALQNVANLYDSKIVKEPMVTIKSNPEGTEKLPPTKRLDSVLDEIEKDL